MLAFAVQMSKQSWDDWHQILGHIYHRSIKAMKDKEMVTSMEIDPSSTPSQQCTICIQAKHHVNPFLKESQTEYKEIGDIIHRRMGTHVYYGKSQQTILHLIYRWTLGTHNGNVHEEEIRSL